MTADDQHEATAITTPGGISAWHFLSRMHQLALELNTGMHHSRGPLLRLMYQEGLIDAPLRGTKTTKRRVLALMVQTMQEADPGYQPSASIVRALNG